MIKIPQNSLTYIHNEIKDELQEKFSQILDANDFILGSELAEFETGFASFCDTKYAVGVGSGYDALFISLKVLGVKEGDEIIVPAHTFIATWLAVTACGAKPIPVEINEKDWTINSSLINSKVTARTKGIIPVHLFGTMCEMEDIMKIASENSLFVLEDFSQAQGASFKNNLAGSFGEINAASLYPGKNLGALGDAGVITTNNEELYHKVLQFRNYGAIEKNKHEVFGVNSRLDNLQAAFLNIKLKHLQRWNQERSRIATIYQTKLREIRQLQVQEINPKAESVFHQFVILTESRDELMNYLQKKGIQTSIHYPTPILNQTVYKTSEFREADFQITKKICDWGLSLPIYPGLKELEVNYICQEITKYFEGK